MRLKYWVRAGFQTLGIILGASCLYAFLMFIQMSDTTWEDVLVLLPVYLILFGAMMLMSMSIGLFKMNLPLVLSFGSTRNEALLGLQLFRLIPTLVITILVTAMCALAGSHAPLSPGASVPLCFGAFLFAGAIGSFAGVIFTKYGKLATILTIVIILLCSIGAGFIAGLSLNGGFAQHLIDTIGLRWIVFCLGLFLYSISMIPEQRIVWKCNVKL